MPIPTYEQAMLPILQILGDGMQHAARELADAMADHFRLTPEERAALLPSGKASVIRSRSGWALSYMKQAAVVTAPRRGWYEITPRGRQILSSTPTSIDSAYLMQFPEFRDFRARSGIHASDAQGKPVGDESPDLLDVQGTPDEALQDAYARLRGAVEAELLDTVKTVSPSYFEQIVIDLLVSMGYGGNREEAARAVGRAGDGGIDGIIDEDRLGLDVIYVQAKRWESVVGRPEIQKFAGALQGHRARKGIFITTSSFTKEAEEFVQRIDTRIVLVDGRRLATLMFEHDVGVAPRKSYTVKTVDGDYFEE